MKQSKLGRSRTKREEEKPTVRLGAFINSRYLCKKFSLQRVHAYTHTHTRTLRRFSVHTHTRACMYNGCIYIYIYIYRILRRHIELLLHPRERLLFNFSFPFCVIFLLLVVPPYFQHPVDVHNLFFSFLCFAFSLLASSPHRACVFVPTFTAIIILII